jgi:hypothetical protein
MACSLSFFLFYLCILYYGLSYFFLKEAKVYYIYNHKNGTRGTNTNKTEGIAELLTKENKNQIQATPPTPDKTGEK